MLSLAFAFALMSSAPQVRENRVTFAAALHKVDYGWTKARVKALLGPPDDVWGATDSIAYVGMPFHEVWCYGTRGHLTLPVLGTVSFKDGKVEGGTVGDPPPMNVIGDKELESALRAIDRPPDDPDLWGDDPLRLIRAANRLRPLGKEKALAVMTDYERLEPGLGDSPWLFWLTRALFRPSNPLQAFEIPVVLEGAPHPSDLREWPTYPVFLVDDVPICIARGTGSGAPEPFRSYVERDSKNWVLRAAPLHPPDDPFLTYQNLIDSPQWPIKENSGANLEFQRIALMDVLDLVRTGYGPKGRNSYESIKHSEFDRYHREFLHARCRWNDARQMYVPRDGSIIDTAPKRYPRWEFEFEGVPGLRLRVSLWRTDDDSVTIYTECDESKGEKLPIAILSVLDADSGEELDFNPMNLEGNQGLGYLRPMRHQLNALPAHEPGFQTQVFMDVTAKPGRRIRFVVDFRSKRYESEVYAP